MDANVPRVILTSNPHEQCARWDCRIQSLSSVYCHESCQEMAKLDSKITKPFLLGSYYSSPTKFANDVATKLLRVLKAKNESGVPQLSQDLLKIRPWESDLFHYTFPVRVNYCEWLFIALYPIPETTTTGFKWKSSGRSKMIGDVRHCVFDPFPKEDTRWKLHRYSSIDYMEKAVYMMRCNKKGSAIKPTKKRKWSPDKLIVAPITDKDVETYGFMRLYSEMEGLERYLYTVKPLLINIR